MSIIKRGLMALSCLGLLTWSVNLVAAIDPRDQQASSLQAAVQTLTRSRFRRIGV